MNALEDLIDEIQRSRKGSIGALDNVYLPQIFVGRVEDAVDELKEIMAKIKGYEMALDEVFKAYPDDIFPDTTQGERDPVIEQYPGFIDRTSAMAGRHIANVIRERAAQFTAGIIDEQKEQS